MDFLANSRWGIPSNLKLRFSSFAGSSGGISMRPQEQREGDEQNLFRSRLDQVINMDHSMVKLARTIDWGFLEEKFGAAYADGSGRPTLPTRLLALLAILKHTYNVSDEVLCELCGPRPLVTNTSAGRSSSVSVVCGAGYRMLAEGVDIRLASCWSHDRRNFYELVTPGPAPIASEALEHIAGLYARREGHPRPQRRRQLRPAAEKSAARRGSRTLAADKTSSDMITSTDRKLRYSSDGSFAQLTRRERLRVHISRILPNTIIRLENDRCGTPAGAIVKRLLPLGALVPSRPQLGGLMIMRSGRIARRLVLLFLVIVIIEGSAALICRFLLPPLHLSPFLWNPDLEQARSNWIAHSSLLDEEIGGYRVSIAKYNSEFPDGTQSCGSAYGDSYVGGADVANQEGWIEQLSHLLGCRMTNYAVGNYGTDQAYLRFRQVHDNSPIALLGINPNTVMDNVSQYDGLLGAALEPIALKGRFLFDSLGHLKWLPAPHLDGDGFVALNRHPAETLPHSYFLPDTHDGPVTFGFPYTVTLARIALMQRLHNILARRAEWSSLYSADHPSSALQLMLAICEAFAELAKERGERPLIVMLPLAHSFREKANYGDFEYAPLVSALLAKGIEVFDPGTAMIESLAGRSACTFFTNQRLETTWLTSPVPCGGHYSIVGNTTMAQLVAAELRRRNFISP